MAAQKVISDTYAPVTGAAARPVKACERDGSVRSGLDAADVLLLMGFLGRVGPGGEGLARARRIMELAIDGFRP
ncbi:hypothetical protein [Streptomyces sp. Tue6028]|uniref:hypothetical protein n=1 Tax=Streptomyces sp. Tue6028 TaxID=2036037 RepID=UPI003D70D76F